LKDVPPEFKERYLEQTAEGMSIRQDLRRAVIFGRNDLVQDAPISRIDLLISRNVLMYFTAEAQVRILERFNFALNATGYLFLGKSEMLITHTDLFTPHDLKVRVFRKVPGTHLRERLAFVTPDFETEDGVEPQHTELRDGAAAVGPVAQVLVDSTGVVVDVNEQACRLFDLTAADTGRPFQDLEISYRPTDLRTALENALAQRTTVRLAGIPWLAGPDDRRVLDIDLIPVSGVDGTPLGATIVFQDVTGFAALDAEHERRKRELQAASEQLHSTVEELETTNEELQSTNEELETTNEELQSTNEELETMNEELQSTNEELETINDELRQRTDELDDVNAFLETILSNLGLGLVVVDAALRVQVWNGQSAEMWGVQAAEALGQPLASLDIGLPVGKLKRQLREVVDGDSERATVAVEAVNRRGKPFPCDVTIVRMNGRDGLEAGAVVLVEQSAPA
jgi:two-component system CheB/CheR fusion protein